MLASTNSERSSDAPPEARVLTESLAELERVIARHRRLLEGMAAPGARADAGCAEAACPCRRVLRDTLVESIAVLEETRKAFKSKQLAALRRKLMRTLAEHV
ncbi:MAG TPA: hypothetical protein PKI11_15620 [Candidatus Hydrogenedentes bacterium]|nr:hypothetical protein [Candidatus Hydrogenedentota bacterium]HNT86999.1 hypothetical protein [Candidatus Hydrogenedentota bacterium]